MNQKKDIREKVGFLYLPSNVFAEKWYIFTYRGNQHSNKEKYLYSEDGNMQ